MDGGMLTSTQQAPDGKPRKLRLGLVTRDLGHVGGDVAGVLAVE
jgi:hypothetical protein